MFTKEFLEEHYINQKKSFVQIANETEKSKSSVEYYLKKFNIPRRPASQNFKDLRKKRFGRLIVLKCIDKGTDKNAIWLCKCDCGTEKEIRRTSLIRGATQSCGCLHKELIYKGYELISGQYWHRLMLGANERNIQFNITIEQAWNKFIEQNGKCKLTGKSITLVRNLSKKRHEQTASLDRIDSSIGYESNNIQWIHKDLQNMKRNLSDENFISLCKDVANYN